MGASIGHATQSRSKTVQKLGFCKLNKSAPLFAYILRVRIPPPARHPLFDLCCNNHGPCLSQALLRNALPDGVERFDQCRVPLALSAFDISRLKTRTLTEGDLAPALRATCTFPGLFAPVWHPRGVLIDGGVSDTAGAGDGCHLQELPSPDLLQPPTFRLVYFSLLPVLATALAT